MKAKQSAIEKAAIKYVKSWEKWWNGYGEKSSKYMDNVRKNRDKLVKAVNETIMLASTKR